MKKIFAFCRYIWRSYEEDLCSLRSSALTFFTLLSIVPVLAMAFGIAKGFGLDEQLETDLLNLLGNQEVILLQGIEFAKSLLNNTQGGVIAGVGVLSLFYSVLKLFENIERSFNGIWDVSEGRTWARRVSDCFSFSLLCPIILIASNGISLYVTQELNHFHEAWNLHPYFKYAVTAFTYLLPYFAMVAVVFFLFSAIPNTNVGFIPALCGSLITSLLLICWQWLTIHFQIGISQYGAIYGSFAAFPLFLIWLHNSWSILLLGAEIASVWDKFWDR